MNVLEWILAAITIIGLAIYVYGYGREPGDESQEYNGWLSSFKELFTDPNKKVRKIGIIIIYAAGSLLILVELLSYYLCKS